MRAIKKISRFAIDSLRIKESLSVDEWADRYRILPPETSAEHGRWSTAKIPYTKKIMEDLSPSSAVEEVYVMKGTQLGFTEVGFNWLLSIIDYYPGPTLFAHSDEQTAKQIEGSRFAPSIDAIPRVKKSLNLSISKKEGNTILLKSFPGGFIRLVGTQTSKGLRGMPAKNAFIDELDVCPRDVEKQGDPVSLLRRRQTTFVDRKLFAVSSPTVKGASMIENYYQTGTMSEYFVPCLGCGFKQTLKWKNLNFKDLRDVFLVCEKCHKKIYNHEKTEMLRKGEWIDGKENQKVHSYWINSLYSPVGWEDWEDVAVNWLKANQDSKKGSPEKLKTFINSILAETWEERGETVDPHWLMKRREDYPTESSESGESLPERVVFLTAGADIQKDRIEVSVIGWGKNVESWHISHHILYGETMILNSLPWQALRKILNKQWLIDGEEVGITGGFIDSGYHTSTVLAFCSSFPLVLPLKGVASGYLKEKYDKTHRIRKYDVNVSFYKEHFFNHLKISHTKEEGVPYCHFPANILEVEFFNQLTSEEKVIKDGKIIWKKNHERNEVLDCRIYAMAAAYVLGVEQWNDEEGEK